MQDVNGVNLWGGRTYVRGTGYSWLDDHGVIEHIAWTDRAPDRLGTTMHWRGPDGRTLLVEERTMAATGVDPRCLGVDVLVHADQPGPRSGDPRQSGHERPARARRATAASSGGWPPGSRACSTPGRTARKRSTVHRALGGRRRRRGTRPVVHPGLQRPGRGRPLVRAGGGVPGGLRGARLRAGTGDRGGRRAAPHPPGRRRRRCPGRRRDPSPGRALAASAAAARA